LSFEGLYLKKLEHLNLSHLSLLLVKTIYFTTFW